MVLFDGSSAICNIYVFKEGLFSPIGHDLCVTVKSFQIAIEDGARSISARFDPASVQVGCALMDGVEKPDLLSEKDRKEIDHNIFFDVLDASFHREISFRSSSVIKEEDSYSVDAILLLHGTERRISFSIRDEGKYHRADIWLHLPDFGIKPFTALFGALRIKPDVLIKISIPTEGLQLVAGGFEQERDGAPTG